MYTDLIDEHLGNEVLDFDTTLEENIFDLFSLENEIMENIENIIFQDVEYLNNILKDDNKIDPGLKHFLSEEYFFLNSIETDEEFKEALEGYMLYKGYSDINRLEDSFESIGGFIGRSVKGIGNNAKKAVQTFKDNREAAKAAKLPFLQRVKKWIKNVIDFLIMMITGAEKNEAGKWGIFTLLGLVSFVWLGSEIMKFTRSIIRKKKDVEKFDRVFKIYHADSKQKKYNPNKANVLTMTNLKENVLMRHINTSLNIQNLKQTLVPDQSMKIQNEADYNKVLMGMKTAIQPYTDMYGITIEKNKVIMNKKLVKDTPDTDKLTSLGYGPNSIATLSGAGRQLLLKLNREVGGDMNKFIEKHENYIKETEQFNNSKEMKDRGKNQEEATKMSSKDAKKIIDYNQKATRIGMTLYCKIAQKIMRQTLNQTAQGIKAVFRAYD